MLREALNAPDSGNENRKSSNGKFGVTSTMPDKVLYQVWITVLRLTYKRQLGQRAKRKYQPSDCFADPRRQPPLSCRQLEYEGATSKEPSSTRHSQRLRPICKAQQAHANLLQHLYHQPIPCDRSSHVRTYGVVSNDRYRLFLCLQILDPEMIQ
ncbi:hypothetical protein Tco_1374917 [Tanacetum coccineum]